MKIHKMKHVLIALGYLALISLGLNGFDLAADIAYEAVMKVIRDEGKIMTAVYTVVSTLGIGWLIVTVFAMFSAYMTKYEGKPLLEKYQKELEAGWLEEKTAIENKLLEYDRVYELNLKMYRDQTGELKSALDQLRRARATGQSLEKMAASLEEQLRDAKEELKILRGPLESGEAKHFDDQALDWFVVQMRAKLKKRREDGVAGWNYPDLCTVETLRDSATAQFDMGNYVNAANYTMMTWVRDAYPEECKKAAQ